MPRYLICPHDATLMVGHTDHWLFCGKNGINRWEEYTEQELIDLLSVDTSTSLDNAQLLDILFTPQLTLEQILLINGTVGTIFVLAWGWRIMGKFLMPRS